MAPRHAVGPDVIDGQPETRVPWNDVRDDDRPTFMLGPLATAVEYAGHPFHVFLHL